MEMPPWEQGYLLNIFVIFDLRQTIYPALSELGLITDSLGGLKR